MANTVATRTLHGGATTKRIVREIHIISDGTEETDTVIYDNSAFVADTSKGKLTRMWLTGAFTGAVRLEWDQTTDSAIVSLGTSNAGYYDFRCFGGIDNPAGTGATGDLTLTTTALAALDELTIIVEIDQT